MSYIIKKQNRGLKGTPPSYKQRKKLQSLGHSKQERKKSIGKKNTKTQILERSQGARSDETHKCVWQRTRGDRVDGRQVLLGSETFHGGKIPLESGTCCFKIGASGKEREALIGLAGGREQRGRSSPGWHRLGAHGAAPI